jgi:carboxynorspermidine decarboxylase
MTTPKTRPDSSSDIFDATLQTPALVWDMDILDNRLNALCLFAETQDCTLLYSIKASAVAPVLERIGARVSGFSCSSPFEAQLARQILGAKGLVSFTSPTVQPDQYNVINDSCDHISFNSRNQWHTLPTALSENMHFGLRVNPEISIVEDPRYDPCRENSKLGIPLSALVQAYANGPNAFNGINGLHIHTACGNRSFKGLVESIESIEAALPEIMQRIQWINLGGGYYFDKIRKTQSFADMVTRLRRDYELEVFIEPGTAVVQNAASIITTIVDIIEDGAAKIAVLDTSVNHMPEVFVYQFHPPVMGARPETKPGGKNVYTLAGATCLAGDLIGTYAFEQQLEIGEQLKINKMGAYTHAQSHWFNGINLPAIYTYSKAAGLKLERAFSYEDFSSRCGFDN